MSSGLLECSCKSISCSASVCVSFLFKESGYFPRKLSGKGWALYSTSGTAVSHSNGFVVCLLRTKLCKVDQGLRNGWGLGSALL